MTGQPAEHALHVLEFPETLHAVARRASSELGRERVRALRPKSVAQDVRRELARVADALRLLEQDSSWILPPVPDVTGPLDALRTEGVVLDPTSIHRIGVLLASSRNVRSRLRAREDTGDALAGIAELLVEDRGLERAIGRSVDADGIVLDGASRDLKSVRSRLRARRAVRR